MKTHLILTVDYEIFGNGEGCLEACVLNPADQIMHVAENYNAPITFFAEALEFMAISNQLNDQRGPRQLSTALQTGHDVQLHIHPQWLGASYDSTRQWSLSGDKWRIGDLTYDEIYASLQDCKHWLEEEVAKSVAGYRCLAFRAGGWCIQPSRSVVKSLLELGFLIDSTVAPGQKRVGKHNWSDFTKAPKLPLWRVEDDVLTPTTDGLLEAPIACGKIGAQQHLKALWLARRQVGGGLAPGCRGSYASSDQGFIERVQEKSARLWQLGQVMLDFSTLPSSALIRLTRQWIDQFGQSEQPIPLVAIAHTKNFSTASRESLDRYLNWAKNQQEILFSTFDNWYRTLSD